MTTTRQTTPTPEPPDARPMTARQREIVELVTAYVRVAQEAPSAGWLSRRLRISRHGAYKHLQLLRERNWLS